MPLSYGAVMLDREQLQAFAERGFVVVPQVVPQELLAQASRTIDELLSRDPPAREVRGPALLLPPGQHGSGTAGAAHAEPGVRAG
jgi:hypothetical protein